MPKRQLFVMRVLRIKGEVIGTGWTGKMVDDGLNGKDILKALRKLKILPKGSRPTVVQDSWGERYTYIYIRGEIEFVLKHN